MAPNTSIIERHFDRWAWYTVMTITVFVILGAVAAFTILNQPSDGWQLSYNDYSPPPLRNFAGDWPTPLQLGDQIVAVDGLPVHGGDSQKPIAYSGWREGQTVTYTIIRGGVQQEVGVTLHRLNFGGILRSLWYTMTSIPTEWFWSLIALIVFLLRPRNTAAQLMMLAFVPHNIATKMFLAATTISHNFAPAPVYYVHLFISYFWGYLFFPSIILIAFRFPEPVFPLNRWPRAVSVLMFGVPLVLSLLSLVLQAADIFIPITLILQALLLIFALGSGFFNIRKLVNNPIAHAQARWVLFGFALSIPPMLVIYLMDVFRILKLEDAGWLWEYFLILVLPVCLAIAITRYRLFDIEVILRRTLQYSLLTLLLALMYFIGVVMLQSIFSTISGIQNNEQVEDTAVIFSTLAIATLFTPLRRRVQQFIDRRFFRSKYDAEQILAQFAVNTRQEVGLEPLSNALLTAVEETMQPEAVHLWMKPGLKKE